MPRIGILTCSNATQDLGCSSASCLAYFARGEGRSPIIRIGTHQEHIMPEEFRERVKRLFRQPRKTMVDIILNRDR